MKGVIADEAYCSPGKFWLYAGTNADKKTDRMEVEIAQETKTVLEATTAVRARGWKL